MISTASRSATSGVWHRLAALLLVVAALGLPINDLIRYALLVLAAVAIFSGSVSTSAKAWIAAFVIVALTVLGKTFIPAPRIDEGHNVFIVDGPGGALEAGLPPEAFALMKKAFDAQYPPERRCARDAWGCWRGQGFPDRAYAFSADGILERLEFSRGVTGINFSDPTWLRLGFVNERKYNWNSISSDVDRVSRLRGAEVFRHPWQAVFHPWQLQMPWYVVYRFPAEFAGSHLCWTGEVLWEGAGGTFAAQRHSHFECRTIEPADAGRRIFGVAIAKDAPLAMALEPPAAIRLRQWLDPLMSVFGVFSVLGVLVRCDRRRLVLPGTLIALSLLVVLLNDASFIGGVRAFDGGDDGLFYDGTSRLILQHLLRGDVMLALQGEEKVFYYGGPGLRYLRAFEHVVFGETYLGYLSLMLFLPFAVLAAFRRFLPRRAALALTLVFIAIPIGALFGTSLFHYVKWAARGFADPAAAVFFLAGFVVLIGRSEDGPDARFVPALGSGFLFALALFVRPNLAPGAAVLLAGAGIAALWQGEFRRVVGLCIGFAPVFSMALHNWMFGGVFVLFSANATIAEALPMPPSAYVAAFGELMRLDFGGEHVRGGVLQVARWLAGPSESFLMIPLHALAIVVLLRVGFARRFDPWLRLTAWSALALHPVALFYLSYDRYYYLMWFLTLLVTASWAYDEGFDVLRRWPRMARLIAEHPARARLARMLAAIEPAPHA